jgi:hypothetical protein
MIYLLALRSSDSERAGLHAVRAVLKHAKRRGLRALHVRELKSTSNIYASFQALDAQMPYPRSAVTRITTMDMRDFKKPRFLKVADFQKGPQQMRIEGVLPGKYDKPNLVFESGDKLGLSATNLDILAAAYGWESDSWIGHTVELFVGEGEFGGKPVDMVLLKPIPEAEAEGAETAKEPAKKKAPNKPPQLRTGGGGGGMDDEVPFAPEWRG